MRFTWNRLFAVKPSKLVYLQIQTLDPYECFRFNQVFRFVHSFFVVVQTFDHSSWMAIKWHEQRNIEKDRDRKLKIKLSRKFLCSLPTSRRSGSSKFKVREVCETKSTLTKNLQTIFVRIQLIFHSIHSIRSILCIRFVIFYFNETDPNWFLCIVLWAHNQKKKKCSGFDKPIPFKFFRCFWM